MWKWSEERRLLKRKKAPTANISSSAEALGLPFSEEDWKATPTAVRHFIIECEKARPSFRKLAERTIRFGVLWRKRSRGTGGDTSEFCSCAIRVGSNASPSLMSLWMRSLLVSRDENLVLNGVNRRSW